MANVLDKLSKNFMYADGPLLSALDESLAQIQPSERLCLDAPDAIHAAHQSYLDAGASILRTSTFQAQAVMMEKFGLDKQISQLNWTAAKIAGSVVEENKIASIAGNVGPLGVPLLDIRAQGLDPLNIYIEQIGPLLDGGCRFIIFERFSDIEELSVAIEALRNLHHCPAAAILQWDGKSHLHSAFQTLIDAGAEVMGVNANLSSTLPQNLLSAVKFSKDNPFAVFLDRNDSDSSDQAVIHQLKEIGVSLVGFNHGYSPAIIHKLIKTEA